MDDQLTDADGPYVELMAGVYTDNQPDFAWLLPGETKSFQQYWYPLHAIGVARQATPDAAVSLSARTDASSRIGVITTARRTEVTVAIALRGGGMQHHTVGVVGPDAPWLLELSAPESDVDVIEVRAAGAALATWRRRTDTAAEPWVATAPPAPRDIDGVDELHLTATHLAQYRHPTRSPLPYLAEILRRDPDDTRAATTLGAWHLTRGEYESARERLSSAVTGQTRRNLNPRDGEAHYLLGLALERLGEFDAADDRLARAAWNAAWAAPAALARGRLALRRGDAGAALRLADAAGPIAEARRLRVLALRALGRPAEADAALDALAAADPLDPVTMLLSGRGTPVEPRAALDAGAELARAGAFRAALAVTGAAASGPAGFGDVEPIRRLLRAMWADAAGDAALATSELRAADLLGRRAVFAAGLDQHDALVWASAHGSVTAAALQGTWLLDAGRTDDAREALRHAVALGADDTVTRRNLALAMVRAGGGLAEAAALYEAALTDEPDGRLVLERDLLAQLEGTGAAERLRLIERHLDVVRTRDDLSLTHVGLLLDADRVDDAWRIMSTRVFRPFEGGEGIALAAYDRAACAVARRRIADGRHDDAIDLLRAGIDAPAHLGEGRHPAVPQAERLVLLGDALAASGEGEAARDTWSTARRTSPLAVDARPADEQTYWIGVAHARLGELAPAADRWAQLDERAAALDRAPDAVDYFATSLPELLVFDLDTADRRADVARRLRDLATAGRALTERMDP